MRHFDLYVRLSRGDSPLSQLALQSLSVFSMFLLSERFLSNHRELIVLLLLFNGT
jgi:hypothetical protein